MGTLISPALAFRTGIVPAPVVTGIPDDVVAISAAADGGFWGIGFSSVYYFDAVQGPQAVASVNPTGLGPFVPQILAAVSRGLVYYITTVNGTPVIQSWTTDSGVATLPALPSGDAPTQVSAAADGTLWALGASGALYSYASNAWSALPSPGDTVTTMSVGSATFGIAVTARQGGTVMQYQNGQWSIAQNNDAWWVAACADGSYWSFLGGVLFLFLAGGEGKTFSVPGTPPPPLSQRFAASTKYGCYYISGLEGTTLVASLAAYGVMDMPALAWPAAMNAMQTKAYDDISNLVMATGEGGIRAQYRNTVAPFATWVAEITVMQPTVDPTDFEIVRQQILTELGYVQATNAFFANFSELADKVSTIQTDTYNQVVQTVGLPSDPSQQPDSIIEIIFGKVYDEMTGAAMNAVTDGADENMTKAINVGMSVFKYGADTLATKYGVPNCDEAFKMKCAELAGELAAAVTAVAEVTGTLQTAILTDWGKLSACGAALSSGTWTWSPDFDYSVLANIGQPTQRLFYQTLVPTLWQISRVFTFLGATKAPQYALMYKWVEGTPPLWWWWICAPIGAAPSLNFPGPWPNENLLRAINGIDQMVNFFTNQNGWALPVAVMDSMPPEPPGLAFQPWVDSPNQISS